MPGSATACGDPASCTGDVSQAQGSCDGAGACTIPATANCLPYTCDSATGACKTTCTFDGDCSQGAKCDTSTGKCAVTTATCKGPYTVAQPNGQEESCAPYKCVGGACVDSCSTDNDCAPGYDCDAPTCVPGADAGTDGGIDGGAGGGNKGGGDDSGGCGCRVAGERDQRGPGAALGLLMAALALSRRRRRAA
jgi:MYXO-CTERM domain-containing protein